MKTKKCKHEYRLVRYEFLPDDEENVCEYEFYCIFCLKIKFKTVKTKI